MKNIYVISETHYSNDYDISDDVEIIISFDSKQQAEKFVIAGKENQYEKHYDITCITLID